MQLTLKYLKNNMEGLFLESDSLNERLLKLEALGESGTERAIRKMTDNECLEFSREFTRQLVELADDEADFARETADRRRDFKERKEKLGIMAREASEGITRRIEKVWKIQNEQTKRMDIYSAITGELLTSRMPTEEEKQMSIGFRGFRALGE